MNTSPPLDREHLLYRPCVGIALFNAEGKVFVGERIDTPKAWQMPQGGIDEGETIEEAAFRELKEEVGTDKGVIIKIAEKKLRYDLPDSAIQKLWNGKYRGQEQTWVAMRFTGHDKEIDLNSFHPPEFTNWQWVDIRDTLTLIVPFKRELYKDIINLFTDLEWSR